MPQMQFYFYEKYSLNLIGININLQLITLEFHFLLSDFHNPLNVRLSSNSYDSQDCIFSDIKQYQNIIASIPIKRPTIT